MCFLPSLSTPTALKIIVLAEALAVDVDDQDLDLVPAPLLQLFELLGAGLDDLPAHGAARNPYRGG